IEKKDLANIIIAYEPVWAIGVNGKPITFGYADEMLTKIRGILTELFGEGGESVPVFYGGSVNNENAVPLSHCRDIDGLFIGRSAWDADNFNSLIRMVMADRAARL
ncbi:MAG: triose-phosphate isomerase, partial [Eubacteriales bacterium]|nr:triose-phosphate isomerase [Eubacteriales bacterium]